MAKVFRGFTDDFRHFMRDNNAWPPHKNLTGMRDDTYKRLRYGEVLDERYARKIVLLFLDSTQKDPFHLQQFNEFFKAHGWPSPSSLPVDEVIERVCTTPYDHSPAMRIEDFLLRGIAGFGEALFTPTYSRLEDFDFEFRGADRRGWWSEGARAHRPLSPSRVLIVPEGLTVRSRRHSRRTSNKKACRGGGVQSRGRGPCG